MIPAFKLLTARSRAKWNPAWLLLIASILAATSSSVAQQPTKPLKPNSSMGADKSSIPEEDSQHVNSMTEEMRVKREIKFAEKEHRQNLDRAKEASDLGQNLAFSFKRKNALDREDIKKLDKLEKLANRIRSEAGGSDDEFTLDTKPKDLAEAMDRIATVSASLNDNVQETPRQVVSTAAIDKANVLLELIRIVRSLARKV